MKKSIISLLMAFAVMTHATPSSIEDKLASLETSANGRLGVAAMNTKTGRAVYYRGDERFPIASTYKILPVAALLKDSASEPSILKQKVKYKAPNPRSWSPVTKHNARKGMTLVELMAASISYSDSTATDLVVEALGGPYRFLDFAKGLGDKSLRLDTPGHFAYTSTPIAMSDLLKQIALGDVLPEHQRNDLMTWMKNNTTGDARIRSGVPSNWVVADKTGSGAYGVTNDLAVVWAPNSDPIIMAIYYQHKDKSASRRPDVIAQAASILANGLYEG